MNIYDYIIVGASPSGCQLIHDIISKTNYKVLLIERGVLNSTAKINKDPFNSGATDFEFFSFLTDYYHNKLSSGENIPYQMKKEMITGKGIGGGSLINGTIWVRCSKKNLEEALGPNHSKYYEQYDDIEKTLGIFPRKTNMYEHQLISNFNINQYRYVKMESEEYADKENDDSIYTNIISAQDYNNKRISGFDLLKNFFDNPNLVIISNTIVDKILFNGNIAIGVVDSLGKKYYGNKIILSAGAIYTPCILMRSGIGPKDLLSKLDIDIKLENEHVGKNLKDRYGFRYSLLVDEITNIDFNSEYGYSNLSLFNDKYQLTFENVWGNGSIYRIYQYFTKSKNLFDIFFRLKKIIGWILSGNNRLLKILNTNCLEFVVKILRPSTYGSVTINTKDSTDKPIIDLNYFQSTDDVEICQQAFDFIKKIYDIPILNNSFRLIDDEQFDNKDSLREICQTAWHFQGTCAINNVVDENFNIYGFENLQICDISVINNYIPVNTMATSFLLGRIFYLSQINRSS